MAREKVSAGGLCHQLALFSRYCTVRTLALRKALGAQMVRKNVCNIGKSVYGGDMLISISIAVLLTARK
jgi:hypothetical protein